ncbi:glycoside hydrolase [Treponema sp. R80B11-R83G3]
MNRNFCTNKKNVFLIGMICLLVIFSFVFSCSDLGKAENPDPGSGTDPVDTVAETPVISELASRNYAQNDEAVTLSANAKVNSTTAILSYKWYKNTALSTAGSTLIEDVNDDYSYTPSTAELGDTYYYVVVTNTDPAKTTPTATRTSNIARIRVTSEAAGTPAGTITVNTATKYQYIRGFGGMSNVWTSPAISMTEVDKLFGPTGLGLNIFRICIYPYMDDLFNGVEEGPENDKGAHQNYFAMVRRAKKHGALILASPWTPPGEWKTNGTRLTGKLLPEHYSDYANHLKNYIKRMADNGAAIDYISTQNEPDIGVSYDGCEWTGEEMRDFVKQYGNYFLSGTNVKLAPGESYQFRDQYYNPIYNDTDAMAVTDVIAGHIYGGGLRRHTAAINAGKEVWMTEHLFNTSSNYAIDSQWQSVWVMIKEVHDCMVNDFNAYVWWYAKRFYSLIGDGEYQTREGMPLFRGYALSHYAKYATGKTRVAVQLTGGNGSISVTAYESDDEIALVLFNEGSTAGGKVNINIPVEAKGASMVITQGGTNIQNDTTAAGVKAMAPDVVVLSADGKTGTIDLPASCIISIRFTK